MVVAVVVVVVVVVAVAVAVAAKAAVDKVLVPVPAAPLLAEVNLQFHQEAVHNRLLYHRLETALLPHLVHNQAVMHRQQIPRVLKIASPRLRLTQHRVILLNQLT